MEWYSKATKKVKLFNLNNVLRDQPLDEISESGHYMMPESSIH